MVLYAVTCVDVCCSCSPYHLPVLTAVGFVECSAKTMQNLSEVFESASNHVMHPKLGKKKRKVQCAIL